MVQVVTETGQQQTETLQIAQTTPPVRLLLNQTGKHDNKDQTYVTNVTSMTQLGQGIDTVSGLHRGLKTPSILQYCAQLHYGIDSVPKLVDLGGK